MFDYLLSFRVLGAQPPVTVLSESDLAGASIVNWIDKLDIEGHLIIMFRFANGGFKCRGGALRASRLPPTSFFQWTDVESSIYCSKGPVRTAKEYATVRWLTHAPPTYACVPLPQLLLAHRWQEALCYFHIEHGFERCRL